METTPGSASKEEGLRLLKAGQFDEAVEALCRALQSDSDDPQIHTYLGVAYHQKKDRLRAIHEFEEALRLEESPKAYFNLGKVYEEVHRIDEAVRQYRMAVDLDPNYAPAQEAIDRLHSKFEAAHTAPQPGAAPAAAPEPTMVGAAPTLVGAAPARIPTPGTDEPKHTEGPPDFYAREAEKQREIDEQHKALMKSGLIYGLVCGAVVCPLAYFGGGVFAGRAFGALPEFATRGAGLYTFAALLAVLGAVYGALIGLWVGHTCGGEGAGAQAGAAMGAFVGLVTGLIARGGALDVIISLVMYAIASAGMGFLIGRLVDASIGWD